MKVRLTAIKMLEERRYLLTVSVGLKTYDVNVTVGNDAGTATIEQMDSWFRGFLFLTNLLVPLMRDFWKFVEKSEVNLPIEYAVPNVRNLEEAVEELRGNVSPDDVLKRYRISR